MKTPGKCNFPNQAPKNAKNRTPVKEEIGEFRSRCDRGFLPIARLVLSYRAHHMAGINRERRCSREFPATRGFSRLIRGRDRVIFSRRLSRKKGGKSGLFCPLRNYARHSRIRCSAEIEEIRTSCADFTFHHRYVPRTSFQRYLNVFEEFSRILHFYS